MVNVEKSHRPCSSIDRLCERVDAPGPVGPAEFVGRPVVGYVGAFIALSALLRMGMPVGGVFTEALTWRMGIGIVLIAIGMLLIELGSQAH